MLMAGILGQENINRTANLVYSIFTSIGKKVSINDSGKLVDLDSMRIKSYINELVKNKVDILILKINFEDADRSIFDNLHFDIMIFTNKADELDEKVTNSYKNLTHRFFSLLDEKGIAIVNVDDNDLIKILSGMKYYTVTYGFNSKASITASSTGDMVLKDSFLCCLQRSISAKNGLLVEPQEYRMKLDSDDIDVYNVLAAATFAIVNGIDLNAIDYTGIKM